MGKPAGEMAVGRLRDSTPEIDPRYQVPNLERGLRILELLQEHRHGLSQTELAARLGYSKTSVFRVTRTLLDFGYLLRNEETKTLRLSRKLLALGTRALAETDLMASAIDVLRSLRDEVCETVLIGTIAEDAFIVLEQVLGSHPFKFSVDRGARLPLHTSAPAKAILAFLPEGEREALLGRMSFPRFNDRTITSLAAFRREVFAVRACGFALDRGEQLGGIHCVAAPVLDRHGYPIAGVWTTGPADRLPESVLPVLGERIASRVRLISQRQGYGPLEERPGSVM